MSTTINDSNRAIQPKPKIYRVLITQSSTTDPTVVELENEIGAVVAARTTTGTYTLTLTGAFTVGKTFYSIPAILAFGTNLNNVMGLVLTSADVCTITTGVGSYTAGTFVKTDALLTSVPITITVYP